MPLFLLIGQDQYQIQQQISKLKARLNPNWLAFNAHAYSTEQLSDAIATARTLPIFDDRRLVLVENCQFQQFTERHFELLQKLVLPAQTILVFTGRSIEKRSKVVKLLLKIGKLQEFDTIPPWRTDLIESAIAVQAKHHHLSLPQSVISYLATAIGGNRAKIEADISKLSVYASRHPLSLTDVKFLVADSTHHISQLAEAIRVGDPSQVAKLFTQLLARSESPFLILSTLLTQFRIWLWIKSALASPMPVKDKELAQQCGINNPKRLYYLRQEVAAVSIHRLAEIVVGLFSLEYRLKQGESSQTILPVLLTMAKRTQRPHSQS